ncbi:LOW QUALITY PROTEIN: N-acetyllactosaminide beta-1,3-N-acetylglucosaminyltransferase 2 [Alosa alosa]|uniref:LOW QUALITY PROTEIN: N-acetyllactosaminide beta-1,3-N-acetylglucosaminyltransferase 2 n=1 Tax=Alosa alosa TaxID=278164 RepID=UPI0020152420|nr:LOW QUALITY PROTEIN: N-acetyllactosaminide beta-1,3-N-acetylglucosaminyltransferase 2 [Alosa alosa]
MKGRSRAFAATLVICSCLIFIYSNLNQEVPVPPCVLPNTPVRFVSGHPSGTPVIVDGKINRSQLPHVRISTVHLSPAFRNDIPMSSAFWNRKFYSGLKKLDKAGNLLQPEISSNGTPQSTEYLQTNIADFNKYPSIHQDFLRSMHFRSPDILINQPNKCTSNGKPDNVTLLFAIKSSAQNFAQRQTIRQTWGQEGFYEDGLLVRTVFILGNSSSDDPDLGKLLSIEAQEFGDLLVWDFKDTFFNLTLKEHVFYKWSILHCPQVSFIFKGDDDIFVNTKALLKYLKSLQPGNMSKLYLGQIIMQASPLRDPKIKYYVPHSFYDGPYPPYAGGGGFVFSGALLESLYSMTWYIPFFPIDDVYTGMCFQALGIAPEKHNGFRTFDIMEKDREDPCVHKDLLVVHRKSPQQTLRLWRKLESPLLTC